jgi:hypothetical protein
VISSKTMNFDTAQMVSGRDGQCGATTLD